MHPDALVALPLLFHFALSFRAGLAYAGAASARVDLAIACVALMWSLPVVLVYHCSRAALVHTLFMLAEAMAGAVLASRQGEGGREDPAKRPLLTPASAGDA